MKRLTREAKQMEHEIKVWRSGIDGDWRWRVTNIRNAKVQAAITEGYRNRKEAFKNLYVMTGWRPRYPVLASDRQDSYSWFTTFFNRRKRRA